MLFIFAIYGDRSEAQLLGKPAMTLSRLLGKVGELAGKLVKPVKRGGQLDPEETMTVPEIIRRWDYPAEDHSIETPDGYIIGVHRIPHGKGGQKDPRRIPVLVYHGIECSSADWVYNLPNQSIGFLLAEAGYDVWLANHRGNYYSRRHTKLNPDKDKKFFDYSWAEIGEIDAPTVIDYILKNTGHQKLQYIGYSMGTTISFVLLASKPEYNDKIISVHDMAAVTDSRNNASPLFKIVSPFTKQITKMYPVIGPQELLPKPRNPKVPPLCAKAAKTCLKVLVPLLDSKDDNMMNKTRLRVYYSHFPSGTSLRSLLHYFQTAAAKTFRKFDMGPKKNKEVYGQETPPEYDYSNIKAPVYLYSGPNDHLAPPVDMQLIAKKLPNLKQFYIVPHPKFNHLDFTWAVDAPDLVYNKIIANMKAEDKSK